VYYTHTLDRANLGNAKTMGIEKYLNLVENQFSLVLILFYIPYGLCNIPAVLYVYAKYQLAVEQILTRK
jgi:hypothetical protein